jgi:hypothetical protein
MTTSLGNAFVNSGSITTIFVSSAMRCAYFPRTIAYTVVVCPF